MSLRKYFQPCLDLPGVSGAFCLKDDGALIESFMPAPYTDSIFEELGPRVASMMGAIDMSYAQTSEFLIRFEINALYLKKGDGCIIGIFTSGNPMVPGLRISTNLLLKQAQQAISQAPVKVLTTLSDTSPEVEIQANVESDEDDIIITPTRSAQEEEAPKKKKGGFFGSKKDKKPKPKNDIWG